MRRKRERLIQDQGGPSLTKQSFKQECDVNFVVKNHGQRGMWDHLNPLPPTYGDFTGSLALQEATQLVEQAQLDFDSLPAEVRSACHNDPAMLLQLLANQDDTARLVELGLPLQDVDVPLSDQIAEGVANGLASSTETPEGAKTPGGQEGPT